MDHKVELLSDININTAYNLFPFVLTRDREVTVIKWCGQPTVAKKSVSTSKVYAGIVHVPGLVTNLFDQFAGGGIAED